MSRGRLGATVGMAAMVGLMLSGVPDACPDRREARGSEGPGLVMVPAGTAVDGRLPRGWTDRVIRSVPRLASGEIATLPESADGPRPCFGPSSSRGSRGSGGNLASTQSVSATRCRSRAARWSSRRTGRPTSGGRSRPSRSSSQHRVFGAEAFPHRLPDADVRPLRSPSRLVVQGVHSNVNLYYAVLVDPATGEVATFNWSTLPVGVDAAAHHLAGEGPRIRLRAGCCRRP